jgi:lipopolysaccharide/colanic/teichoic acid biosynthesis glycosyltransferase
VGSTAGPAEARDIESVVVIPTSRETPVTATSVLSRERAVIPAERYELAARAVNVLIAAVALLIVAPICVLVALAVKLTSPGPVFYTQTRVGVDRRWNRTTALRERRVEDLGGQPFTILKFRSMRTDAEANGQAVWATKHDARITPIGRVLRKTRLDEIPQLINVLRGEMNIVGPRPERPSIVVRLRDDIPEYPQRHRVKPGITGWAQINHSYDSCLEDVRTKVRFDLDYIERQSMWFDLRIMVMTLPVMLFRKGAH